MTTVWIILTAIGGAAAFLVAIRVWHDDYAECED